LDQDAHARRNPDGRGGVLDGMTTNEPLLTFETALGRCGIRWSDIGITSVLLPSAATSGRLPLPDAAAVPADVRDAIEGIQAVLEGKRRDLRDLRLDERGIDSFRRRVYAATRDVQPGTIATYGQVARAIGEPEAARDVGAALARNPMPVIVPCHRVIAANGALHGFSAPGGIETKRRMLQLEGAPGFGQQVLFG
jgi:methylated-DNA-[protein]-cysteine S-methyltransferase